MIKVLRSRYFFDAIVFGSGPKLKVVSAAAAFEGGKVNLDLSIAVKNIFIPSARNIGLS